MPTGWNVSRFDREVDSSSPPGLGPAVVLDNIRSAFNVGSIFRTCDAAGARHLYLGGICPYPPNPKLLKTSLGAEQFVPWTHTLSTIECVEKLASEGVSIVSVELTDQSTSYIDADYPENVAFVFGHEVAGVAVPILNLSNRVVQIPMQGRKNSLNVGTSVGVVLFEHLRRQLNSRRSG
jgi:23S rRNA (guanosine2251-2'-O)-methyltransferase